MNARLSPPIQLKAQPNSQGEFRGYASTFDGPPDGYGDIVVPGAFKNTIADHASRNSMPALLWAHDQAEPIGVWKELKEDSRGLLGVGQLTLETVRGREAYALMRDGALGLSIGYRLVEHEKDTKGHRLIKRVDLLEVSAVSIPANHEARIHEVKALLTDPRAFERAARDVLGLSARQAKRLAAGGWSAMAGEALNPDERAQAALLRIANAR